MGPTTEDSSGTITKLLKEWHDGDMQSRDRLFSIVYASLRRQARAYFARERPGQVLQPTALVHEAFLRLAGQDGRGISLKGRTHFFAVASSAMRRVLMDQARKRHRKKRGGGTPDLGLAEAGGAAGASELEEVILLGLALEKLEKLDAKQGRIFECYAFAGLSTLEISTELGILESEVQTELRTARAWLRREIRRANERQTD